MSARTIRCRRVFWLIAFSALAVSGFALSMDERPPQPASASLEKVLSDDTIWGKDFDALVSILASANAAGEETLFVFPDKVVVGRKSASLAEARSMAQRLTAATQRPLPKLKPKFQAGTRRSGDRAIAAFPPEAVAFPEDDSFRAVWSRPGTEFLKRDIPIQRIEERFGPPESVTTMVVQNEYERRPVILTLHSYAGGAIIFAESDWAPVPGMVDRVLLDVRKATRVLFAE